MTERYEAAGVDYDVLDRAKRLAIQAASATSAQLGRHGGSVVDASRGEPAFVFSLADRTFALVLECLGTKSVLARQYQDETGEDRFGNIAYDSVAAIVNDLCCVGALPLVVNAYFSTGHASWYADESRFASLVEGWRRACEDCAAVWGGGESPSLPDLVSAADIEIAGSAIGEVPAGVEPLLGQRLAPGNDIVLVASTGLHANGASLVRALAAELTDRLATKLGSGRTLGGAALDASAMYVGLVRSLLQAGVPVTYLSHITGHGLRKLMRPSGELSYRIHSLPAVPEVLSFIARSLGLSDEAAYATFNMGAGFAVYCEADSGAEVVQIARRHGLDALVAGKIEAGPRSVILEPVGVEYGSETLSLR